MSEEESGDKSPPSESDLTSQNEQNDSDINLFASVWVKIETVEEDVSRDNTSETPEEQVKRRRPYKKCDLSLKNLKCDQCDYKTKHKNCLDLHILGHTNDKPFSCTECDYKTTYPTSLKRHISVKHEEFDARQPTYKCSTCSYQSKYKWNLSSHQRKHNPAKVHKCPHCTYSTSYKHSLVKHSRTHIKPKESTYYCDKCPFATKYEGHISRHLAKIHFVVSDKANRCENCPFSTRTRWRLNVHRKRSHQNKSLICAYCDYHTVYRCAYREHKLTHTEGLQNRNDQKWLDSLFVNDSSNLHHEITSDLKEEQASEVMKMCEIRSKIEVDAGTNLSETTKIFSELKSKLNEDLTYYTLNCNDKDERSFPNISQQTEHEKNNHYIVDLDSKTEWSNIQVKESTCQDRPFQCINCNYSAKFKASVQRHYQRHHTSHNRPYKCMNCDFRTKTKDQITLHNKRSRSDEILTCKMCGFTSVFKCQFTMHEKEHYPFKCVKCEFRGKKKLDMQKHFTIVHLGTGLKCRHCDFTAIKKESLLCHEALHTGKKPFQCQLCEYTSVRNSLLENHINRFHKSTMNEEIALD